MAKVVLPALSGQASGKLGDVVFLQRFGRTIARIRKKPANPKTPMQQLIRGNLAGLSQIWNGKGSLVMNGKVKVKKYNPNTKMYEEVEVSILTQEEKQKWEQYATQKRGYRAYGRLEFIGQNIKRLKEGMDIKRTP